MYRPTLVQTLLLLYSAVSSVTATCYWQNSTLAPDSPYSIAPDDTACFPGQTNSPCCGTGWSCLSDGVCYIEQEGQGYYYRGTCTDKTWDSQQCPGWCFAENSNTSIPLINCKRSDGQDWYCCPGDPNCDCDTGKDAVKLGASQPVTATVIGSTSWPGYIASTTILAGDIAAQGTSTNTATSTGTGAAAAQTTSPASSPSASNVAKTSSNTALAAGLGAGLGAAVLFVAAAGFYILRSRRRRSASGNNGGPYTHGPESQQYVDHPGQQKQPLPQSVTGYYATSTVNEKDGRQTFATQELPGSSSGPVVEMMGSSHGHPQYAFGDQPRVELA